MQFIHMYAQRWSTNVHSSKHFECEGNVFKNFKQVPLPPKSTFEYAPWKSLQTWESFIFTLLYTVCILHQRNNIRQFVSFRSAGSLFSPPI